MILQRWQTSARASNIPRRCAAIRPSGESASKLSAVRSPTRNCTKAASLRSRRTPRLKGDNPMEEIDMPNTAPGFTTRPDYRVDLVPGGKTGGGVRHIDFLHG